MRLDAWWVQPAIVFVILSAFIVYATWAAFQGDHYTYGPYLSPFYSPEVFGDSPHSWFGPKPAWWPRWMPFSPALLILPFPGMLPRHLLLLPRRLLQGVLGRPASLRRRRAAHELPRRALSCRSIIQNVHRYFLYFALVFLVILAIDVWKASGSPTRDRRDALRHRRRARSSSPLNVVLLGGYTLRLPLAAPPRRRRISTALSRRPVRKKAYDCVELPQPPAHEVGVDQPRLASRFADLYIRLCSMGIWTRLEESSDGRSTRRTSTTCS